MVAKNDDIRIYDSNSFYWFKDIKLPIENMTTTTREPVQVLATQKCPAEVMFAVITGKKLVMNQFNPQTMQIFKCETGLKNEAGYGFDLETKIELDEIPEFKGEICMSFHFLKKEIGWIMFCTSS